jgi:hypothetical protein
VQRTTQADKVRDVQSLVRDNFGVETPEDDSAVSTGGESADLPTQQELGQPGNLLDPQGQDTEPEASTEVAAQPGGASGDMTVQALAEQLGTTPKKLYESLAITTGDGETLTLGQLKDRVQGQETATREIVQREQSLQERESAVLQNMQTLQSVMSDLEGKLSPQVIQQMQQRQQRTQARERALMLDAMPELKDPHTFNQFRSDLAETLNAYGFEPSELVINDHRILKVVKDFMGMQKRLEKLLSFDPEREVAPPKQQKTQGRHKRQSRTDKLVTRARHGTKSDKIAGVSALLQKGAK